MIKNLGSGFKFLAQPLCELGQVALPLCAQLIWKMSTIKVLTSQDYCEEYSHRSATAKAWFPDPLGKSVLFYINGVVFACNSHTSSAAAAKSLQSCLTLCDPIDGSPPGSPSLGFSRQEHWSGLPFPSPMHKSEK